MIQGQLFTYWALKIVLLLLVTFCGYKISKSEDSTPKKLILLTVVAYALFEGLRWMRGVDYYHYYLDITTNLTAWGCTPKPELLYKIWCSLFYSTGLSFEYAFILYAAIFIGAYILLLQSKFRETALWTLPTFFLLQSPYLENHIRQYISMSFILIAVYYALNDNKKFFWIFSLAGVGFHLSAVFFIVLWIGCNYIPFIHDKRFLWALIMLYLSTYFFWDNSYFAQIANVLSKFNYSEDVAIFRYMDDIDGWFTEEGSLSGGQYNLSLEYMFFRVASSLIVIIFGHRITCQDESLKNIYLLSYISLILQVISGDIELFMRFYMWTAIFIPLLFGVVITRDKGSIAINNSVKYFFLVYIFVYTVFFQFTHTIDCMFIWDK